MSVTFHTTVMKAENKNATGISIPEEVMTTLAGGKKPSVSVTLNGYTYRTTIAVMGGEYLIPLSEAHRQASGLKAGDPVEVTLALDLAPRTVEVPSDLHTALSEQDGAVERFEALAFSKRKEFVRQVEDAKTQETRLRRIANVVTQMSGV
ncbi:YdeI/OmpD-associated family protein [Paenibacillus qinlingensis]|uniref:YdeI/OmpD-associated family protein n=1 Tax=Paenibacillus qinlingensis TaxID=1837343 RepID=UPI001C205118|nr:YdeI/OmpD-associated family protein [Paenibacillus qinlingensis]